MEAQIQPLRNCVLIKRIEKEPKTAGGIIIPETAKEKPVEGEVVAVGEGELNKDGGLLPMKVKVGDRVLFGKWAGTELSNPEYVIMKETDILAIIKK